MPPKRYFEFDGLRGLLALWVALGHLVCWCGFGHQFGLEGKRAKLWIVLTGAEPAAQAFVILSGFAIATLLQREQAGYGKYMLRRLFRIYPVYLFTLLLAIWLAPATGLLINNVSWASDYYMDWQRVAQGNQEANPVGHVWAHLLLIHGLIPKLALKGVSVTYLLPAWSIGLEEQFYLVAPWLLLMLRKRWGLMGVLALAVAGQVSKDFWSNPVNSFLPQWLPFFLIGIGSSYTAAWLEQARGDLSLPRAVLAFGALVAVLFLSNDPLPFLIWGVACPVALGLWKDFAPVPGMFVAWILNNRLTRWIGDMSYSLYLLHWPLIIMLLVALQHWRPGLSRQEALVFMLGMGFPVILLCSWVIHLAVEKPFMALGRRLARRPRAEETLPVLPTIN